MYTSTVINIFASTGIDVGAKTGTAPVRRTGNAIPAYFLGRPRDRWVEALAPTTFELADAA